MPKIYKYTPYVVQGPFGTTIIHKNTADNDIFLLGQMGGEYYISVPDGIELPEQPEEITLTEVPLDSEQREQLRKTLPVFRVTRKLAQDRIDAEMGTISEQLADTAKRIGLVERLVMRMALALLQGQPVPQSVSDAYLPIVQHYIQAIDEQGVHDRVDLESNVRIAGVLINRFARIADIVDDLHMQRVKELIGEEE